MSGFVSALKQIVKSILPKALIDWLYIRVKEKWGLPPDGYGRGVEERNLALTLCAKATKALDVGRSDELLDEVVRGLAAYPKNRRIGSAHASLVEELQPDAGPGAWLQVVELDQSNIESWKSYIRCVARVQGHNSALELRGSIDEVFSDRAVGDMLVLEAAQASGALEGEDVRLYEKIETEESDRAQSDRRSQAVRRLYSECRYRDVSAEEIYDKTAEFFHKCEAIREQVLEQHRVSTPEGIAFYASSLAPGSIERLMVATARNLAMGSGLRSNSVRISVARDYRVGEREFLKDQIVRMGVPLTEYTFYPRTRAAGTEDPLEPIMPEVRDLPVAYADDARRIALQAIDQPPRVLNSWQTGSFPTAIWGSAMGHVDKLVLSAFGFPDERIKESAVIAGTLRAALIHSDAELICNTERNREAYAEWLGVAKTRISSIDTRIPPPSPQTADTQEALALHLAKMRTMRCSQSCVVYCENGMDALVIAPIVAGLLDRSANTAVMISADDRSLSEEVLGQLSENPHADRVDVLADADSSEIAFARCKSVVVLGRSDQVQMAARRSLESGVPVVGYCKELRAEADGDGLTCVSDLSNSASALLDRTAQILTDERTWQEASRNAKRISRERAQGAMIADRLSRLAGLRPGAELGTNKSVGAA